MHAHSPSPVIGEDFLSDLDLHTIHCLVGGHASKLASRPSSLSNVARLNLYPEDSLVSGLNPDTTVHQIRIITEVCVCACVRVYTCLVAVIPPKGVLGPLMWLYFQSFPLLCFELLEKH